jgi:hypothetical protein
MTQVGVKRPAISVFPSRAQDAPMPADQSETERKLK